MIQGNAKTSMYLRLNGIIYGGLLVTKGVSIWNRVIQYVTFDCSFLSSKYALRKHVLSDESILNENLT